MRFAELMEEAVAADGGGVSTFYADRIFCHWRTKGERLCSTSRGRRESLQMLRSGSLASPPLLHKPLKNLSSTFWFKVTTATSACAPEHCLMLKKIGTIFLNKWVFKAEPAHCRKPPSLGASSLSKREKENQKRETGKKKPIIIKMILQIRNVSLTAKWGIFTAMSC